MCVSVHMKLLNQSISYKEIVIFNNFPIFYFSSSYFLTHCRIALSTQTHRHTKTHTHTYTHIHKYI